MGGDLNQENEFIKMVKTSTMSYADFKFCTSIQYMTYL